MDPTKNKLQIGKLLLIAIPSVFIFLLFWIATVYIGNTYFGSKSSSGQFLLWILSGIISFICYPIASKQISNLVALNKNKIKYPVFERQKFDKSDCFFFIFLHSITALLLFWIFSDLEHHVQIYNFFVDTFGRNYKGAPNFPVLLIFIFGTFFLLAIVYVLFLRIRYGTFNEPKSLSSIEEKNFKQKQEIYFSYVASTTLTVMMLYLLKMVLLV